MDIYPLIQCFCVSWCGIRIFYLSWHHRDKERKPAAILWLHLTNTLGVLDAGLGDDACVKKLPCEFCELLTPEQVLQLSTPTYKIRKEKKLERESLIDPSTVTVLSSVDQDKSVDASSSLNTSEDLSLPQPSFKKNLQDLDEK